MKLKKLFITLILGLALLLTTPALAADVTANDIAEQLMCMCGGCGDVLSECHCDSPDGALEMKTLIGEQLAQGKSEQEILDYFYTQYGAGVLAPPKQDSSLMLWIALFLSVLAVGAVIYLTQKKRARGK